MDVAVASWVGVWVLVGLFVHGVVSALVAPTRSLADGAGRAADELERTGEGIRGIPLVGSDAASPLDDAARAVDDISASTSRVADLVEILAVVVGVLVPLAPVLLVVLVWLLVRLRFARRAGAARALLDAGADEQLFALRALANQPLPQLAAVSSDPVGDWRRGDPRVTGELARLELEQLGVRRPRPRDVGRRDIGA